jgi:DNA mismatch repair ATPase MutS
MQPQSQPRDNVEKITFLYKLRRGAASASFGLNVAMLAGLPRSVVARAAAVADALQRGGGAAGEDADDGMAAAAEATEAQLVRRVMGGSVRAGDVTRLQREAGQVLAR